MRPQHPIRILLVEDNRDDAVLVREALRGAAEQEFVPEHVVRLEEGLSRLKEATFDAILLDLSLPDSHGIATFQRLHGEVPGVPVVILSGDANDATAEEALEQGAQDYIVKDSATPEVLVRTLRYAITRNRLTTELQASEHRLRLLSEQLPAIIWTTDRHLTFTSLRGRDLVEMDLVADQIVGTEVAEFFGAGGAPHPAMDMHCRALEGESVSSDFNWGGRWYHAHVEPLQSRVGDMVGTIGVALDVTDMRKLRRDVEAAHRIQQHLLPRHAPKLPGFDIAGACFPAEDCSGDFFDYVPLQNGRLAIVLADVSGHGFGPAILAAAIRSYLRTAAVLGSHVHEMLALGNRLLASDADANPFASVFSASLDARARTIQFASAGHPAYLVRRGGDVETLESACVPIGVRDDEVFPLSRPVRMHRGDILLLASDGVFETRHKAQGMFGVDRAMDVIRQMRRQRSSEIVMQLHRAACDFAGTTSLEDDVTAVVVKAEKPPSTDKKDSRRRKVRRRKDGGADDDNGSTK